jgi:hypothetical protein
MGGRFKRLSAGPRSRWNVAVADVRFEAHCGLKSDFAPSPKMGWTGRAPAPNRSESERGLKSTRSTPPCPVHGVDAGDDAPACQVRAQERRRMLANGQAANAFWQ